MKPQRGIALLQVLLLTAIIMTLCLQVSLSAQNHVLVAQSMKDRAKAEARLHAAEAEVLFALLTERWENAAPGVSSVNPVASRWNFYGEPVALVDGVTIRLQDDHGLMPLFNGGNPDMVLPVLGQLTGSMQQARAIRRALIDWQGYREDRAFTRFSGQPRDMMQTLDELKLLPEVSPPLFTTLLPLVTRLPHSYFNPLTAPSMLLEAWLPGKQAEAVLDARQAGSLTGQAFTGITGIQQGDDILFAPNGMVRMTITVKQGKAERSRSRFIRVRPFEPVPLRQLGVDG